MGPERQSLTNQSQTSNRSREGNAWARSLELLLHPCQILLLPLRLLPSTHQTITIMKFALTTDRFGTETKAPKTAYGWARRPERVAILNGRSKSSKRTARKRAANANTTTTAKTRTMKCAEMIPIFDIRTKI